MGDSSLKMGRIVEFREKSGSTVFVPPSVVFMRSSAIRYAYV